MLMNLLLPPNRVPKNKPEIVELELTEQQKMEIAVYTGKTRSVALAISYEVYCIDRAMWLSKMSRIPRKLKKKYKKNSKIWDLYNTYKFERKQKVRIISG